jgi:hypothetical protein
MDQVTDAMQFLRLHPSAWVVGILAGVALTLGWPAIQDRYEGWYDEVHPPVVAEAVDVEWGKDQVQFHLLVKRLRTDCEYRSRVAYSTSGVRGLPREIRAARTDETDGVQRIVQRPAGVWVDTGVWRLWPTEDASSVELWALYICNGRQVQARLISLGVPLAKED